MVGWKRFLDTTDGSVKAIRRDESIDPPAADGGGGPDASMAALSGADESIPKQSEPVDEFFFITITFPFTSNIRE